MALCDGLFAAGSLWFLVAAIASHARLGPDSDTPSGTRPRLRWRSPPATSASSRTALTVLSRRSISVARTVGGIAAGITVIAIDDIWLLVSGRSGYSLVSVTLVQIGLLLLLLTAAAPPLRSPATLERTFKIRRGLEVLPFVPMLACVAVTFRGIGQRQRASLSGRSFRRC